MVQIGWADTMWVHNQAHGKLGGREDFFIKISRFYVRDSKTYMYTFLIGKLHIAWAKIKQ